MRIRRFFCFSNEDTGKISRLWPISLGGLPTNETQTEFNVFTRWTKSFVQQADLQTELAYVQPSWWYKSSEKRNLITNLLQIQ